MTKRKKKEVEQEVDCFGRVWYDYGEVQQQYDPEGEDCKKCGDNELCKKKTEQERARLEKQLKDKQQYDLKLLPLSEIEFPQGIRKEVGGEKLEELKASIKERGLQNPITVEVDPDSLMYKGVTGFRRFTACKELALKTVPCLVRLRATDNKERVEEQLIENIQRDDLTSLELCDACSVLTKKYHYSLEKLAKKIGLSVRSISRILLLKGLSEESRQEVDKLSISKKATEEIAKKETPEEQKEVIKQIKEGKTAEQLEEERKKKKKAGRPKGSPKTWTFQGKGFEVRVHFFTGIAEDTRVWSALEQAIMSVKGE